MNQYSRQDALRILRIQARQLASWERSGLIPPTNEYGFQELVQLSKLRDLRATRISVSSIRNSLDAMQRVSGVVHPLLEATTMRNGSRVVFRHSGRVMDPMTQQFLLDFDAVEDRRLQVVGKGEKDSKASGANKPRIGEMFLRAVQLEEDSSGVKDAAALYTQILDLQPAHAPSCINLGTILYNQRQFIKAESLYRRATEADPGYALAFFDLGNVLDELQRLEEAVEAYRTAIRLAPSYADAHYNLALAYERRNDHRRALPHWLKYVKLDPVGPWANHARNQARKILDGEKLTIVYRRTSGAVKQTETDRSRILSDSAT